MNFREYIQKAKRTDLEDYSDANSRTDDCIKFHLKLLFEEIKESGYLLDKIKKFIFYNKEIKLPTLHKEQYANLSNSDIRIIHCIIGILTEAAELSEIAVKLLTDGRVDYINLIEEIGDCAWYSALGIDECSKILKSDIDVLNINIEKLKQRYPCKFTEENAIDRNISKEAETLKKHINA